MESGIERIKAESFIDQLTAVASELRVKIYLTGGGLRDTLLGRTIKDLDFAVPPQVSESLPDLFARRIAGSFFWLDREKLQSRVVKRTGSGVFTFDFAPLRGADIDEDLTLRDFTVNAMALELSDVTTVIDPLRGRDDLRNKTIRRCSAASFSDDPLRLLRAVRLSAQLGFVIETETLHDLTGKAPSLEKMAAERMRDEFFKILESSGLEKSLTLLHDVGLLAVVIPGEWNPGGDESVVKGMRAAGRVEEVVGESTVCLPGQFQRLPSHFGRCIEGEITALSLAKLAAFVKGAARPGSAGIWGARLRLGTKATRMLALLCMDTKSLFAKIEENSGQRSLFRFFRDHEPAGIELVLLALAAGEISGSNWSRLAAYYFSEYDPAADELLLRGNDVMELLGMSEGAAIGRAMEMLRVAESRGLVESKEEAREFLRKNLLTKEAPVL